MREGEFPTTQHHPTAMNMIVSHMRFDCYSFLRVDTGYLCAPLHRQCSAQTSPDSGIEHIFGVINWIKFTISSSMPRNAVNNYVDLATGKTRRINFFLMVFNDFKR
jgi:hypothetical protein